jgi:long-chain acyl-CoA synthetase
VLNPDAWGELARALAVDAHDPRSLRAPAVVEYVRERLRGLQRKFPAHARVPEVWLTLEPWTIENGLITPTLKVKREEMERRFAGAIRELYAQHALAAE